MKMLVYFQCEEDPYCHHLLGLKSVPLKIHSQLFQSPISSFRARGTPYAVNHI
jgi:hypothetical protein